MRVDEFFRGFNTRLVIILLLFGVLGGACMLRLWSEQVQGGRKHREAVSRQSIRRIRVPPIRGRIFSADGKLFTDNAPSYDIYFHIHELRKGTLRRTIDHVLAQAGAVSTIIGRPNPLTEQQIRRHLKIYPALPVKVFSGLETGEFARLHELMPGIPGLEISVGSHRVYPLGEAGAQLLGYMTRRYPSREEVRQAYYFYPERVGKAGLEKGFENELGGKTGYRIVRVDCFGYYHEDIHEPQEAAPGNDLILTLDSRAQALAQRLLAGQRGALVLLNVHTGAILAMVSSPSYDLNRFNQDYPKLSQDKKLPLQNRAIAGGYLPGSIIKPLVALALLERGVNQPETTVDCPGYFQLGRRKIRCHLRTGHGPVDLVKALEVSCNTYFIDSALRLGIDRLTPIFRAAGLGRATGMELRTAGDHGLLPSRQNMQQRHRRKWLSADTAMVAIGQGFISLSPLQAAVYAAAIANGGKVYRPYLVQAVRSPDGKLIKSTQPELCARLPVSPRTLKIVQAGMYKVVHGDNATARRARSSIITLAGKTGTAEVAQRHGLAKNAWFICFGPFHNPKYAMAVLVEGGASGGRAAAPIARALFERYLPMLDETPD